MYVEMLIEDHFNFRPGKREIDWNHLQSNNLKNFKKSFVILKSNSHLLTLDWKWLV